MAKTESIDAAWFRQVLGQYPTGVSVVTATVEGGRKTGFTVGSFTSVSLDPPLVAFFPAKTSYTWRLMHDTGTFCVNVLSAEQEDLCRVFSSRTDDKFADVAHRMTPSGSPILDGVVAWIDCDVESVTEAGDHFIVVGRVKHLDVEAPSLPLLFFRGGYGRFSPLSMVTGDPRGLLTEQLREVDLIRGEMESMVTDIPGARCSAVMLIDNDLIVVATAGGLDATSPATIVGQRLPFIPPFGTALAAWMDEKDAMRWINQLTFDDARAAYRESLAIVRRQGFSVALLTDAQRQVEAFMDRLARDPSAHQPDLLHGWVRELEGEPRDLSPDAKANIAAVSVPVFGRDGEVVMMLTAYGFAHPVDAAEVDAYIERIRAASRRATELLGGAVRGGNADGDAAVAQ